MGFASAPRLCRWALGLLGLSLGVVVAGPEAAAQYPPAPPAYPPPASPPGEYFVPNGSAPAESSAPPHPAVPMVFPPGDPAAAPATLPPPTVADADKKDGGGKKDDKKESKADEGKNWEMSWNDGLWFRTKNKDFAFHAGGTVHYDGAGYQANPALETAPGGTGKFNDGVHMRRARFFFEGTLYHQVDYRFEMELQNGLGFSPAGTTGAVQSNSVTNSPGPTDAWATVKEVPWLGNVRIGNQKEWFSLEHLNSYRSLEFMERSYLFDFSQPIWFSPGVSVFDTWLNDRVFTAAGVYKNSNPLLGFGIGDGQYAVTGRAAITPIYCPEEHYFWHVGGAMSHRDPVNGQVQIRIRDNVRNAPFPLLNPIVNTGPINADSQDLYNLETAAVYGPLTFQAEYTASVIHGSQIGTGPNLGDLFFQGYYVEVLGFLTGESRTWNTKHFFFNRVSVLRPLRFWPKTCDGDCPDVEPGWGAFELGVRYSYLDMSNKGQNFGRLDSVTLGLNWYFNNNAKMQFNYDLTRRGDTNNPAQGDIHAFGTRLAYDF